MQANWAVRPRAEDLIVFFGTFVIRADNKEGNEPDESAVVTSQNQEITHNIINVK